MAVAESCRWCRQPIEPGASRCHHCGSWQREGADTEEVRKAQIIDQGLIYFGKFVLGVGGLAALVLLGASGWDIYRSKEAAVEAKMEAEKSKGEASSYVLTAKNEMESARNAHEAAKLEVDKLSYNTKQLLDKARSDVDATEKLMADSVARIKQNTADIQFVGGMASGGRTDEATQRDGGLQNYALTIKDLQTRVASLEKRVADLERKSEPAAGADQAAHEQAFATLEKTARISQTSKTVVESDVSGGRRSWDVTFNLCALVDTKCGDDQLNAVSSVVYRFDKKWFSVPDVEIADRAGNFAYTVRVWGVTPVTACIFVKGALGRSIIRTGRTSRPDDQITPDYWGPDSGASSACADLHNL